MPEQSRGVWRRAMEGGPSRAGAIKAKCLECSNFQRPEITYCPALTCPLWLYRPYQKR